MEIEPKNLFNKGKPHHFTTFKGRCQARRTGATINVEIYDQGIIQGTGEYSCKSIEFDYDLKFSFNKEKLEIQLERGKETCVYSLANSHDLQSWREILKKKINQRGFHEQFKPIKKIGKGNFASVYLAQKIEDEQFYAVKAFSKEAAYAEENGKQCLIKQIDVARCLDHPNTMKLHEVFESDNSLYIIFQLLEGGQLYDKVKAKHKFKPQQTREIIFGILQGLREMHSKGIMHRDLKPENLIFKSKNQWKCVIADYGLAEFCNVSPYLFVRCGTPGYVAPEVINIRDMSTKYSPICDIYSLGLIFHVLLFGKSAFPGKTYNEVLAQNRAANIDLEGEEYKKLPSQTLDLLRQMLKKNPKERVSADKALFHPYFKDIQVNSEMIDENEEDVPDLISAKMSDSSTIESPLLTSSNPKRRLDKNLKKDSCVEFQMGKQNIMTGKTEEIDQLKSNKISICNASTPLRKPKVSQFCAQIR